MKNPFVSRAPCMFAFALFILACSSDDGSPKESEDPDPPAEGTPTATAVGTELDEPSSASIGAEGGSLTSADGRLMVTVPEGALSEPTTLEIQPITNEAHGGIGSAYRLSPDGLTFAVPATLAFVYEDTDLRGTDATALGVAFQNEDRYWSWIDAPVVDEGARSVSVDVEHFTDFSAVAGAVLLPTTDKVSVRETFALRVASCYPPSVGEDDLQPLGYQCDDPDDPELVFPGIISEWAVNGVSGGTDENGTVRASGGDGKAIFTAPDNIPSPSTVTVSARVQGTDALWLLVSNLEITGSSGYSGDIDFEIPLLGVTDGTATVTWAQHASYSDHVLYAGEGTMSYTYTLDGCTPVTVTAPLRFAEPGDNCELYSCLTVRNDAADIPKTYEFTIVHDEVSVDVQCGEDTTNPYELPGVMPLAAILATYCPPVGYPSYDSDDVLAGSYACMGADWTATWSFAKN